MSRRMKMASVGALCVGAIGFAASSAVAGASPTRAPSASSGTFTCTTGRSGTFTINSGHSTGTSWNVAHLSFTGGGTGIFVPSVISTTTTATTTTGTVVFTTSSTRTKGNGHTPAPNACSISAMAQFTTGGQMLTFSLSGTVTGKLVANG